MLSLSACHSVCNEGQKKCIFVDSADRCCNYYYENECYITCPNDMRGDPDTHECHRKFNVDCSLQYYITGNSINVLKMCYEWYSYYIIMNQSYTFSFI